MVTSYNLNICFYQPKKFYIICSYLSQISLRSFKFSFSTKNNDDYPLNMIDYWKWLIKVLSAILFNVIQLTVILMNAIYLRGECHSDKAYRALYHSVECQYYGCHSAECHSDEFIVFSNILRSVIFTNVVLSSHILVSLFCSMSFRWVTFYPMAFGERRVSFWWIYCVQ